MTQWMQFIQMRPNVVMIDENGVPHLIREAETMEYIEIPEKMPEHLKKINL
jgi:diaminopimelate decarboxylase